MTPSVLTWPAICFRTCHANCKTTYYSFLAVFNIYSSTKIKWATCTICFHCFLQGTRFKVNITKFCSRSPLQKSSKFAFFKERINILKPLSATFWPLLENIFDTAFEPKHEKVVDFSSFEALDWSPLPQINHNMRLCRFDIKRYVGEIAHRPTWLHYSIEWLLMKTKIVFDYKIRDDDWNLIMTIRQIGFV